MPSYSGNDCAEVLGKFVDHMEPEAFQSFARGVLEEAGMLSPNVMLTADIRWPDMDYPGYPLNPTRGGFHELTDGEEIRTRYWDPATQSWYMPMGHSSTSTKIVVEGFSYVGKGSPWKDSVIEQFKQFKDINIILD